jgi:hypothetical protein
MNTPTKGNAPFNAPAQSSGSATPAANSAGAAVRVARGRSIRHDGKTYTAGQEVTLPAADLARLRALGFIAADRDEPPNEDEEQARTQGPTFESRDGPSVKQKR